MYGFPGRNGGTNTIVPVLSPPTQLAGWHYLTCVEPAPTRPNLNLISLGRAAHSTPCFPEALPHPTLKLPLDILGVCLAISPSPCPQEEAL